MGACSKNGFWVHNISDRELSACLKNTKRPLCDLFRQRRAGVLWSMPQPLKAAEARKDFTMRNLKIRPKGGFKRWKMQLGCMACNTCIENRLYGRKSRNYLHTTPIMGAGVNIYENSQMGTRFSLCAKNTAYKKLVRGPKAKDFRRILQPRWQSLYLFCQINPTFFELCSKTSN